MINFRERVWPVIGRWVHAARRWLCLRIIDVAWRVEPADERRKWPAVRYDRDNRIIGTVENEPRN